jgi:acetylornithine/N-succinyldiaminopimelate aminotransferase
VLRTSNPEPETFSFPVNSFERESSLFFKTYKRIPLEIDRGEGCYLISKDGRKYLDLFGGLAVNALGYNHPKVNQAIREQLDRYVHLSNFFIQDPQLQLADRLIRLSSFKRVFLCNSGTEANEGAIKISRKWSKEKGKTKIFGMSNGFNGRTMGALSIMDKAHYREGYEPFLPDCGFVEFNDVGDLRMKVSNDTAAVFLEFIQGEGGVVEASRSFVEELFRLREKFGFLIIADEIQTGIGRTGRFFAFEHYNVLPDIVTLAKPIGGGLPLGAILGNERVADVLSPGMHGTTFGGNPVACAAGSALLDEITDRNMIAHVAKLGAFIKDAFEKMKRDYPSLISDVRGQGFMLGINLTKDGASIVDKMRDRGVLINCTSKTVLRFLPPFILTKEEAEIAISTLREVFETEVD